MLRQTAIITGVTGQDGWYLAELLLQRGYRVVGTTRDVGGAAGRAPPQVELLRWDLTDEAGFRDILHEARPAEVYNLAAYASGQGMFDDPVQIGDVNGLAVARILEAIRAVDPAIRLCQASSSELFGEPLQSPQSEETPLRPRSPYGAAKLYAHELVGIYRRRYGTFACSAILFNHESPRRGSGFVTGKVAEGVARIKLGLADRLVLGNLDARRDWGFAGDYMWGAWLAMRADHADDYVFATGQSHSVRDLCDEAFAYVGLDYRDFVQTDVEAFRLSEPAPLVGDASKAGRRLGWVPQITFPKLVQSMVAASLKRLSGTSGEVA